MSESIASPSLHDHTLHGYSLLRESCGIYPIEDLAILEMRGEDRKAWLQGQCTNDLRQLALGGSLSFCVCAATGQLLSTCTVWSLPERFLIVAPKSTVPAWIERAETMVIIEDVQLDDITERFYWLTIQGPSTTRELSAFAPLPTLDAGTNQIDGEDAILLRSNRTGYGGWDLLLPSDSKQARKRLAKAFEPVPSEAVEIARMEAGIPRFGIDMTERTLPPEMGLDFESKHISYNKGCYTGQEVLMRIHSRGHTNKTWVSLVLEAPVSRGDTILHGSREDAGTVTSAVESPQFGFIATATVRNEAAFPGEPIKVQTAAGLVSGEVEIYPLLRTM